MLTKLCFEFLEGCCLQSAAVPFAHSYEALARRCQRLQDPSVLFLRTRSPLQGRSAVADTRNGVGESFPEDLIGDAGQDLPTDHAASESHFECEAFFD